MASISSPTIIKGFLNHLWTDSSIYSIFSYRAENMGGEEELLFSFFTSPANDMNQGWMHDVRLLYEDGNITMDGEDFLKADWKVSMVSNEDQPRTLYEDNKGNWVVWGYPPVGDNNKPLPKVDWPLVERTDFFKHLSDLKSASSE